MNTSNFIGIPAQMFPEQEILVFENRRLTYGQLWDTVRRLANALRRLGVQPGDRVGALHTNSDQYIAAYYAAAAAGAVFVPLNYRAKPAELEYMIETARIAVLLVGARYISVIAELRPRLSSVRSFVALDVAQPDMALIDDLIAAESEEFEETPIDDDETTILMYTSGTTSRPKGVMLSHNDFTAYVCGTVELADGTPRGTALLSAPLYHIAGATNIMTSLFAGRRLVILPQFDATAWLTDVRATR